MTIARLCGVALASATLAAQVCAQDSFGAASRQQTPQQQQQPQPQGPARKPAQQPQTAVTQPAQTGSAKLDQLTQVERQDFGVAPTNKLHTGSMHGPTPASIPGGQVITTKGVVALVQGKQAPYLLLDVLGGAEMLPGALPAAWAASPDEQVQQQFGQALQQATRGNKQMPLVLYCLSTQCWMSYNASLRAIRLGYTNVLWYRGGLEAWKAAGMPVAGAGPGYQGQ